MSASAPKGLEGVFGRIIDADVHHIWRSAADLLPYMGPRGRDLLRVEGGGGALLPVDPAGATQPHQRAGIKRLDAAPANGTPAGSDYETLRDQLLEGMGVEFAILGFDVGYNSGVPNPYLGAEITRAANDWSIHEWLERDRRLCGGMLVSTQWPAEAAAEIRRIGGHPKIVEVLLSFNAIGTLSFGHPVFHPLYEAAAELDLPIACHIGWAGVGPTLPAGVVSRFDNYTLFAFGAQHHLMSFIAHGVFEKYPNLRLKIMESGVAWLPWILQNLDAQYGLLKEESLHVKRWPSEYFHDHVVMTTQPFDIADDKEQVVRLLETVDGVEDVLCFASDYPHWDTDEPTHVRKLVPDGWLRRLFRDNAVRFYGSRGTAVGMTPLELEMTSR